MLYIDNYKKNKKQLVFFGSLQNMESSYVASEGQNLMKK